MKVSPTFVFKRENNSFDWESSFGNIGGMKEREIQLISECLPEASSFPRSGLR
jgi:hypothetical protein